MGVTVFDVIMFFISLAGGFLVWKKGFFGEIASKASYLIGLLFSFMLSKPLALFVNERAQIEINAILLSFLCYYILFFCGSYLTKWIGSALSSAFEQLGLANVDRGMGFLLGCFEMVSVLTLMISLVQKQRLIDMSGLFDSSVFCKYVVDNMKTLFHLSINAVERR
ncbi:MAG TPA: hypothetical protein DCO86_05390 [Spirochaetaceae bacterium]|nr:hypothetical protein [Spirochaetaceae bacterium]